MQVKDMVGKSFGRLTVVKQAKSDKNCNARWECLCDCGNTVIVLGFALRIGRTKSCGCYGQELRETLMAKADIERRDYTRNSWKSMLDRCYNPRKLSYPRYGGKGITVCDRWKSWPNFFEDMGPKPTGYSIDRIDSTKGYFPENCRWASRQEQNANRKNVGRPRKHPKPPL